MYKRQRPMAVAAMMVGALPLMLVLGASPEIEAAQMAQIDLSLIHISEPTRPY